MVAGFHVESLRILWITKNQWFGYVRWGCLRRSANGGNDFIVMRRQAADRVCCSRITCQQVGLAAASTEIYGLFRAASARLLHPAISSKFVESIGIFPDLTNAHVFDIGAVKARQIPRGMAGQGNPVGCYGQKSGTPAIHTGFGSVFIVVRYDVIDFGGSPVSR